MRWYPKAAAQGHEGAQVAIREILAWRRASSGATAETETLSGEPAAQEEKGKEAAGIKKMKKMKKKKKKRNG